MISKVRGEVDLSEWTIEAVQKLTERITETISAEAMRLAASAVDSVMEDSDVAFADDSGDPLEMRLCLWGMGRNGPPIQNDDGLEYKFSLKDALRDRLRDCTEDGSFSEDLKRLSAGLKQLAAEIDEATSIEHT